MTPVVKFIIKQQGFPTLHTDAHHRLDDISTIHTPQATFLSRSQVFSGMALSTDTDSTTNTVNTW